MTHKCYGCDTQIANTPGNAYCDDCIAKQTAEQGREIEAYDAFHVWADKVSKNGR